VNSSLPNRSIPSCSKNVDGSMLAATDVVLPDRVTVCVCYVYIRPDSPMSVAHEIFDGIHALTRTGRPLLVMGDFNARSTDLGDSKSNSRSRLCKPALG